MKKYLIILLLPLLVFTISCEDATSSVEGVDGLPIMVSVVDEPSGDNCTSGGSKISFGYDNNSNGMLDATEVTDATFVCDGDDGNDVSEIDVQIVQWNSNGTLFDQSNSPNNGDGRVYTNFYNAGVTNDVILNGLIIVQYGNSSTGPWFGIPTTLYGDDGDGGGVDYIYDVVYSYTEGRVQIAWNCSFGRTQSEWNEISSLYETYYKIITVGF